MFGRVYQPLDVDSLFVQILQFGYFYLVRRFVFESIINIVLKIDNVPYRYTCQFLKSVRGQINKLDFLIQALVKTSRLETGVIQLEKEDHFIYDTLAQAMSGIVYSAEQKKIHVSVECPEDVRVSHDSKWTEEAIFNLLDNAVKYTPTGGSVHVSVAQWEMYVEIKVSDTGKGISESNRASIFKRFYREEEIHNQPGVGIGLYLTREIVTQQGGYVTVESQVGKGSAFSIFLPR